MEKKIYSIEEIKNFVEKLKWNLHGLIPAVAQDHKTKEVLMLAYMNKKSLTKTLSTGKMTYYSRSRCELWLKGETSGAFQIVKSVCADCDFDVLLFNIEQLGVGACHTGKYSCFFNDI